MAIKGKKKSQSRGSQARRRPAMAPRPVTGKTRKPPWYKTTAGQSIAAIATLILIVVVLVLVNNARDAAREREQTQASLENYTDQIRALQQRVTPPATELATLTTTPPSTLAKEATELRNAFTAAQTEVGQFVPPSDATTSRDLLLEAMRLYTSAASTLELAGDLNEEERARLVQTAVGQATSAAVVWEAAVALLDDARDEADLDASGVRAPSSAAGAGAPPAPAATVPVQPGGGGGGQGGGGGGNKQGGGKGDGGDG